jgi:hypothetical protein
MDPGGLLGAAIEFALGSPADRGPAELGDGPAVEVGSLPPVLFVIFA